jgi:hypothetical protein
MNERRPIVRGRRGDLTIAAALSLATLWIGLCATPASAANRTHRDPDDARSSLDVRSVHLWEFDQPGLYSLVVRTYDHIDLGETPTFVGWIDAFGGPGWDYAIVIGPSCYIISAAHAPTGSVFAARMDPRKVHCLFEMEEPFDGERLRVWARRDDNLSSRQGLVDMAPDEGWFKN